MPGTDVVKDTPGHRRIGGIGDLVELFSCLGFQSGTRVQHAEEEVIFSMMMSGGLERIERGPIEDVKTGHR
jgi:hypothetical protein